VISGILYPLLTPVQGADGSFSPLDETPKRNSPDYSEGESAFKPEHGAMDCLAASGVKPGSGWHAPPKRDAGQRTAGIHDRAGDRAAIMI
jgi:hypothetical protein